MVAGMETVHVARQHTCLVGTVHVLLIVVWASAAHGITLDLFVGPISISLHPPLVRRADRRGVADDFHRPRHPPRPPQALGPAPRALPAPRVRSAGHARWHGRPRPALPGVRED